MLLDTEYKYSRNDPNKIKIIYHTILIQTGKQKQTNKNKQKSKQKRNEKQQMANENEIQFIGVVDIFLYIWHSCVNE